VHPDTSTATWVTVPSTMLKHNQPVVDGPYSAERIDTDKRFADAAPAAVAGPAASAVTLSVAMTIDFFERTNLTPGDVWIPARPGTSGATRTGRRAHLCAFRAVPPERISR
jgi:hypothetical protein